MRNFRNLLTERARLVHPFLFDDYFYLKARRYGFLLAASRNYPDHSAQVGWSIVFVKRDAKAAW
jgi:hypothetical protein